MRPEVCQEHAPMDPLMTVRSLETPRERTGSDRQFLLLHLLGQASSRCTPSRVPFSLSARGSPSRAQASITAVTLPKPASTCQYACPVLRNHCQSSGRNGDRQCRSVRGAGNAPSCIHPDSWHSARHPKGGRCETSLKAGGRFFEMA